PPRVGVLVRYAGRVCQSTGIVGGSRRLFACHCRLCLFLSCARVGGRPPIPPARRRTGAIRGSRLSKHRDCGRIASAFRLPLPSVFVLELGSGGGATPHTPRASQYWCDTRVAAVQAPAWWAGRVGCSPCGGRSCAFWR